MKRYINNILTKILTLTLLLLAGVNMAWGQDPYEGTWYITNTANYYLCPAGGYYQNDYDTPYLTTYQTGKDKNSIWRIEKVEDGSDTYYRFIHNATGKYLTANDAVLEATAESNKGLAYLRLHLEAFDTPTDATLFVIQKHTTASNNKVAIRSKDYYAPDIPISNTVTTDCYWLDISGGKVDNYWNGNYKGALGFWKNISQANDMAVWTFEAANQTCATPIITYNEAGNTFSISYPISSDGATIHYTTDGTEPTTSSATYSGAIAGSSVTNRLRAIAVATGYNNSEEAMVYGSTYSVTPHLFKSSDYQTIDGVNSYYDFSYYLISPTDDDDTDAGRNYLTTSNVPNPRMQWLIKPASRSSNIQYYYLVNSETGKYVYFTGTAMSQGSKFVVKSRDEDGAEADRFMFRIWEGSADGISYFNFSPKMISYALPTQNQNNMLTKQNATDHTYPTGVYRDDNTGGRARWQMLDVPDDPKSLSALPLSMVSTASNSVCFKLRNAVQTDGNDYFVYPPASAAYATAATTGSNPEWYFVEANDNDTWNTYYYIRNAETRQYLYFDGTTKYNNNTNDNKFFVSDQVASGSEDKYKFLVLKTANTTYSGTYHIVPKQFRNNNNQTNIALNRNNATLRTSQSRNNPNSCWYLDAVDFQCAVPMFNYTSDSRTLTITCSTEGADIYYAIDTTEPVISDANKYTSPVTLPEGSPTVTAIAVRNADASDKSDAATFAIQTIDSGDQITNMSGFYYLGSNFTPSADPIGTADNPFRGTIDGQLNTFSISHPLFGYVENAVIKNIILDNVSISSGISSGDDEGNTGAIACVAKGSTRIYNCGILATNSGVETDDDGYTKITSNSSTVGGSKYVGGLVGLLDGEARVINCFSYANITGGTNVGGIVGYNNVATTSQNLKTMVMNCMFYGDITGGTNKAPIYNGQIITNRGEQNGVGNFNYFWGGASYVQKRDANQNPDIQKYNCGLMAETRFLQRFEFFRHLLNSHRELAAWWATGSTAKKDEMMKWVLEPEQIGTSTPFPILKTPGRYRSVTYIDDLQINETTKTGSSSTTGSAMSTLAVTVQMGSGNTLFSPAKPADAEIVVDRLTLNITDKDPGHFNFNYGKVQLPYYNDVGTKNYTENRVVTGWKIVSMNKTTGSFETGADATATVTTKDGETTVTLSTPYNFADRNCTAKDIYSSDNKRVFNQGAYFDVPEGVTSITIEPYWAKAAYVADDYRDVVYNTDMGTSYNVTTVAGGQWFTDNSDIMINGRNQKVRNTIGNAKSTLGINKSHTVYDYAVVLVGNVHAGSISSGSTDEPYTIMSADFDHDNEPDYSYILKFNGRVGTHPVRVDFLNIPGLGMAQKSTGGTGSYNFGIMQPKGWFESTNTSLFRVTQLEYDVSGRAMNPIILHGGVIEQWVTFAQGNTTTGANRVNYYHVGGNVWFKEFHIGAHQDRTNGNAPHPPISVTGGDYEVFYLTGLFTSPENNIDDNAECYINGGRFGIMAGTGNEGIGHATNHTNGNIIWQIDHADINEFYGGGINAGHIAQGNITTIIKNSHVHQFCGGPEFGDMNIGRTVTTKAENCEFDTYFGAGFGGNSYNRFYPKNKSGITNIDWNDWLSNGFTSEGIVFDGYKNDYIAARKGVEASIDYQFLPESGNIKNVARLIINYVSFSLATTHSVTSELKGCRINRNYYGGGSLGKVDGSVTSILTDCTVKGNVFGAGYSASLPDVEVMNTDGFQTEPHYVGDLGAFLPAVFPKTVTYTWEHAATVNSTATAIKTTETEHILYTTENLNKSNLGSVAGNVTLTIKGNSVIGTEGDNTTGNVYGGGDASYVTPSIVNEQPVANTGNTTVTLAGNTEVLGNVFGGGNNGEVSGTATVNIRND